MELTYSNYLKIKELINLQELRSNPNEHDEMLFIIIHQSYELWFKQILHEIDYLSNLLINNQLYKALHTLKRVNTILKVLVHQVDILETMTPLEFLSFRDYLESASGFQSAQFRELEFILGKKNISVFQNFTYDEYFLNKLKNRYNENTLWDNFLLFLHQNNFNIPKEILERDKTKPYIPNTDIQKILINIYSNDPLIAQFCELLVDLDEGIQEWRYRHIKMVERTIGNKTGTGGSSGADYLKQTLFKPVFPDLWIIRTDFTKK